MKICTVCSVEKEDSEYYTQKKVDAPSGYYTAAECKECAKKRVLLYRTTHKKSVSDRALIRRMTQKQKAVDKFGDKCLDCQQSYPICCYDFHHLDTTEKEYSIGNAFNGYSYLDKELEKCVMLCSNCHRLRHYTERRNLDKEK